MFIPLFLLSITATGSGNDVTRSIVAVVIQVSTMIAMKAFVPRRLVNATRLKKPEKKSSQRSHGWLVFQSFFFEISLKISKILFSSPIRFSSPRVTTIILKKFCVFRRYFDHINFSVFMRFLFLGPSATNCVCVSL